jgi:hypothetical protein
MKAIIGFIFGAVIGGTTAYILMKKRMEEEIDKEVNEVKAYYKEQLEKLKEETAEKEEYLKAKVDVAEDNGSIVARRNDVVKIEKYEYEHQEDNEEESVYDEDGEPEETLPAGQFEIFEDEIDFHEEPYIIDTQKVGEYMSYDLISLIYFAGDCMLTDDWEVPVEDPDATAGTDFIKLMDDGEDIVYVRNDKLKCDFEISKDLRSYEETREENR